MVEHRSKKKPTVFATTIVEKSRDPETQQDDMGTVTVDGNIIRSSTVATRERWRLAAEKELVDNFEKMEAFTEATAEEIAKVGGQPGILPMKSVWTIKPGDPTSAGP